MSQTNELITPKPLGLSSRANSAATTPQGSPRKTGNHPTSPIKSSGTSISTTMNTLSALQSDFNKLERSYADLLIQNNKYSLEKLNLEKDLDNKSNVINQQNDKLQSLEKIVKSLKNDYAKNQELYDREIYFYKELVADLERKITHLNTELSKHINQKNEDRNFNDSSSAELAQLTEKYEKLLKDFRILQSNFELEQNSKLALMDQIEYLNHKNLHHTKSDPESDMDDSDIDVNEKHFHLNETYHTLNAFKGSLVDEVEGECEDDSFEDSPVLSCLADDLNISSSSPIKPANEDYFNTSKDFKFPSNNNIDIELGSRHPSVEHCARLASTSKEHNQRRSLPAKLKTSPKLDQDEFVLSPLKLTSGNEEFGENNTLKRYSTFKPKHTRFNSHDILPIKVEFESLDNTLRSSSVPEKYHSANSDRRESPNLNRNSAFLAMKNGVTDMIEVDTVPHSHNNNNHNHSNNINNNSHDGNINNNNNHNSNNHHHNSNFSSETSSSSKRSSLIVDQSILSCDMTKQEVMKLKFELQSLRLQNEKLLSYIGFELQKQKKNIKKLSSNQSVVNSKNKKMEYSDAKLIEKSRELLIQKKRVLRSVSINGILQTKKGDDRNSSKRNSILGKGLVIGDKTATDNEEEVNERNYNPEEDIYGFLNHNTKNNFRLLSDEMQKYYDIDSVSDLDDDDLQVIGSKKFKSQVFRHASYSTTEDEDEDDDDDDDDDDEVLDNEDGGMDGIKENQLNENRLKSGETFNHGVFRQMRYFVTRIYSNPKKTQQEGLQDENLKYKFLTLAIGIMIIGFRFSHNEHTLN